MKAGRVWTIALFLILSSLQAAVGQPLPTLYDTNLWRDVFINDDWSCSRPLRVLVRLKGDFAFVLPKSARQKQAARKKDPKKSALPHVFSLNDFESLSGCSFGNSDGDIYAVDIVYEFAQEVILLEKIRFDTLGDVQIELSRNRTWEFEPRHAEDYAEGSIDLAAYYQAQSSGHSPMMREALEKALAQTVSPDASYALAMIKGWHKSSSFDFEVAKPHLVDAAQQGHVGAAFELASRLDRQLAHSMLNGRDYKEGEARDMLRFYEMAVAGGHFLGDRLVSEWRSFGFELTGEGFIDKEEPNPIEVTNALNDYLETACALGQGAPLLLGPAGAVTGMMAEDGSCRVGWANSYGVQFYFGRAKSPDCSKLDESSFQCTFVTSLQCYASVPLPSGFSGFEVLGGTRTCPPPFGLPMPMSGRFIKQAEGFKLASSPNAL